MPRIFPALRLDSWNLARSSAVIMIPTRFSPARSLKMTRGRSPSDKPSAKPHFASEVSKIHHVCDMIAFRGQTETCPNNTRPVEKAQSWKTIFCYTSSNLAASLVVQEVNCLPVVHVSPEYDRRAADPAADPQVLRLELRNDERARRLSAHAIGDHQKTHKHAEYSQTESDVSAPSQTSSLPFKELNARRHLFGSIDFHLSVSSSGKPDIHSLEWVPEKSRERGSHRFTSRHCWVPRGRCHAQRILYHAR